MTSLAFNFAQHLSSEKQAKRDAIVCDDQTISYEALCQYICQIYRHLEDNNIKPGQRVAILLDNGVEFPIIFLTLILCGYTSIPINTALGKDQIDYIIKNSEADYVFKDITLSDLPPANETALMDIVSADSNPPTIFFTSGTTSFPKGVEHSVQGLLQNALSFNALTGLSTDTRMLHVLPMGYMAGMLNTVLCPLLSGGTVCIAPQFSAAKAMFFWSHAMAMSVNTAWLTPTMTAVLARFNRNPDVPKWTAEHLTHVFVGTAPYLQANKDTFDSTFGVTSYESYGMTEVMFVSSNAPEFDYKASSVGKLLDGVVCEVRAADGSILDSGQDGQLWFKSPSQLSAYLEDGKRLTIEENIFFDSGDLGYLDTDGYLYITGRCKDIIIHGGSNVSPRAVEDVLLTHPQIEDAAVIGQDHDFWGEIVIAFIVCPGWTDGLAATLKSYCEERLPSDSIPEKFIVLDQFPRSSTGKIKKNELRDHL